MAVPSFLLRFNKFSVIFGSGYLLVLVLLCSPYFQRHVIYLNAVKIPLFADFNSPESYGLSPNKTLNLYIQTPDKETIGAWFVLADGYYQSLPGVPSNVLHHLAPALKSRPTVLLLHGNAGTRAAGFRVIQYEALTARLNANVLVIDYRGFADSTGVPSEVGVIRDARAAFDWLVAQGAKNTDILVMGHSLGTGVASQLSAQLGNDGIDFRGLVLMAPFTSIGELLRNYHIFGFIPLVEPLYLLPKATRLVAWALVHNFDSLSAVPNITTNVLIAHAENDRVIPSSHSDVLFQAFMEPYLPNATTPSIGRIVTPEEWSVLKRGLESRNTKRGELVESTPIPKFGRVDEFTADGRTILLVKTLVGSHDYVGLQEGLQDVIRRRFDF